jgi:predicted patatin/cPLA2 family phospholipase
MSAPASHPATDRARAGRAPAPNITDTALIFEGGGMRASCTAPVVGAFVEAGLNFGWVAGISAGSSHTVNYLSRDPLRSRRSFVEFGADPNLGGLRTWLRGEGMFNAEYIYHHTSRPGEALPLDWATLHDNPADFRIGAFRADDGVEVWWGRDDIADLDDLLTKVQASSTMPVFMPPVHIDGATYVDGAMGPDGGIALDAAEDAGFERFVIVLSRPRGYAKGPFRAGRIARRAFPDLPAVPAALEARPARYNRMRARVFDLERQGRAYVFAPTGHITSNQERDVCRLRRSYEDGAAQIRRELPAIRRFVGLD